MLTSPFLYYWIYSIIFLLFIQWITSFCCCASDLFNIKVAQFCFALWYHCCFGRITMFLFRGRKTSTRKLHSPTVSLHFMQCFFFIAYARFFESFAYFLFNELHNIDTFIWCIHCKRFSVLFVFIGCIWLHSLFFWMPWMTMLFFRSRKPARKLRTQTVSYTLGLKFQILGNWDSLPRSFHSFERDHLVKSTFIISSIGCQKCLDDKPAFLRQMSNIYIF